MNTLEDRTIGQIVAEDYRTAQVFRNFGLDFCCGGKKNFSDACMQKGIDPAEVETALQGLKESGSDQQNYNEWSLDFLIDYIVNNHHRFVRSKLPEITFYTQKVSRVHGDRHPELLQIKELFETLGEELSKHLDKEEQMLFPYIKELVRSDPDQREQNAEALLGSAADPIKMMETEHDEAGTIMNRIEELSNGFTLPEDACATYRVLYQNLEGFQNDLLKHVHLENNILFPKALELEQRMN